MWTIIFQFWLSMIWIISIIVQWLDCQLLCTSRQYQSKWAVSAVQLLFEQFYRREALHHNWPHLFSITSVSCQHWSIIITPDPGSITINFFNFLPFWSENLLQNFLSGLQLHQMDGPRISAFLFPFLCNGVRAHIHQVQQWIYLFRSNSLYQPHLSIALAMFGAVNICKDTKVKMHFQWVCVQALPELSTILCLVILNQYLGSVLDMHNQCMLNSSKQTIQSTLLPSYTGS